MELPELIPGSKAILGFSGGVDSVVLSHLLVERYGIRPYLLHVNYGLRDESDEDERWCRWYAEEHRFEIKVLRVDPKDRDGENLQNWARNLRYNWFQEQVVLLDAVYLFTAHHADDRRETFLMNALRGSGLSGMTGMSNTAIIRPLKDMDKTEVLDYAQTKDLTWREDASNQSTKYTRNKIRHDLAPVLDEVDPRWRGGLKKSIDNLIRDNALLQGLLMDWTEGQVICRSGEYFINEGSWVNRDYAQILLFRYCREIDKGFSFKEIGHFLRGETGHITFGKKHLLVRDRGQFILSKKRELDPHEYVINDIHDTSILPFSLTFTPTSTQNIDFSLDHEWLSMAALKFPLIIRRWRPGDEFVPLGMKGRKKVADFLNELKLPRHHKEHVYVATQEGKLIWVLGYRIDDSLRVVSSDDMAYLAEINHHI